MTPCAIALVLAIDVSGSVSLPHYELQRDATADALNSPAVISAARDGLAVSAIMWGTGQHVVLPWRVLTSAANARAAAEALRQAQRPEAGTTNMAAALRAAHAEFRAAPCQAERRVVDISGDGRHSGGDAEMHGAVAEVAGYGVEINALAIVTPIEPEVAAWFRANVTGPAGGFTLEAEPESFGRAIRMKLAMEVAQR
ncbi:DUF1194 domain-containing protein [Falsiroseomonas tokyonensis]|uniref:DUF1194 domain-containing protein n=1 Tax=Falsiroseomonas tokyonensis TaxID=430521 RepID=A0ABV7C2E4_9PROT|nr:DUF1194 domain-containing protein [Falsiroseomonas tokyonensis]MBU8540836.1 DUF1194 domain-containing protein [Falsiroseomonas tokyonensis]